jgi:hypothetical protein
VCVWCDSFGTIEEARAGEHSGCDLVGGYASLRRSLGDAVNDHDALASGYLVGLGKATGATDGDQ